jgi:hypothetical protein
MYSPVKYFSSQDVYRNFTALYENIFRNLTITLINLISINFLVINS